MPRFLPFLLLLLPLIGCQESTVPTLRPVKVDEAAAYPSQEPGTKPPILTGFTPLTKQQLDEGWVQLFDGVSTFGWEIAEGEGTLSVMTDRHRNFIVFDQTNQGPSIVLHRHSEAARARGTDMKAGCRSPNDGWRANWVFFIIENVKLNANITRSVSIGGLSAQPINMQPLTESDWHPVAGASEAKWTDGVLELTGGVGMVETVKEYGDFILQLEYLTPVRPQVICKFFHLRFCFRSEFRLV
ncbi:MAG: hypothetical protein FWE95_07595 [Planctomycetaceae bacterium]|nr:hypothetical protein [Planctomycetaceae bacterium]